MIDSGLKQIDGGLSGLEIGGGEGELFGNERVATVLMNE